MAICILVHKDSQNSGFSKAEEVLPAIILAQLYVYFLYQTSVASQGCNQLVSRQCHSSRRVRGQVAKEKSVSRAFTEGESLAGNFSARATLSSRGMALLMQLWSRSTVQRQNQPYMATWPRWQSGTLDHICTKYKDTLSLVNRTLLLTFLTIHPLSQFLDQTRYFAVIFHLKSNNKNKLEKRGVSWTVFTLTVF